MQKNVHSYSKPLFPAGEAGILDQPHLSAAMMLKSMESRMSSHKSWAGHCPTKLPMASKADDQPLPELPQETQGKKSHLVFKGMAKTTVEILATALIPYYIYICVCVYTHL